MGPWQLSVHAIGTKSYDYYPKKVRSAASRTHRLTRLTSMLSSIAKSPRGARLPLFVDNVDNRCCCCIEPVLVSRGCDWYGDLWADNTIVPRSSVVRSWLLKASAGRFTPAVVAVPREAAEALIAWRRVDTGLSGWGVETRASPVNSAYDLVSWASSAQYADLATSPKLEQGGTGCEKFRPSRSRCKLCFVRHSH